VRPGVLFRILVDAPGLNPIVVQECHRSLERVHDFTAHGPENELGAGVFELMQILERTWN
jgi:hypothetical protein